MFLPSKLTLQNEKWISCLNRSLWHDMLLKSLKDLYMSWWHFLSFLHRSLVKEVWKQKQAGMLHQVSMAGHRLMGMIRHEVWGFTGAQCLEVAIFQRTNWPAQVCSHLGLKKRHYKHSLAMHEEGFVTFCFTHNAVCLIFPSRVSTEVKRLSLTFSFGFQTFHGGLFE